MGIFNIFKEQLSRVIQWENPNPEILWFQYPSKRDEIKNASKLIVAPGQGCILVYEGQVADVIDTEGIYNLETDNHPFITTLINLRQNFESEHKLHIFFYRKTQILNQPWGTPAPVKFIDKEYKFPVEMGLNGNFSFQIVNPQFFFTEIIGTRSEYPVSDFKTVVNERIVQQISATIHQNSYSFTEIDGQLKNLTVTLKNELNKDFEALGFTLVDFRIEGTHFDEDTMSRIGNIADVTSDVMAAEKAGLSYVELEKLRALRDAARNEGGLAGAGLQFGVGMEIGKNFNAATDSFLSSDNADATEKLRKLKILLDEKIITAEDFETKKNEILKRL